MTLADLAKRLPAVAAVTLKQLSDCRWHIMDGQCWIHEDDVRAALAACAAEMERLESWEGVQEFIDRVYPAEVFDGSSGDPGPRLLVMLRRAQAAEAELDEKDKRIAELEAKLALAIALLETYSGCPPTEDTECVWEAPGEEHCPRCWHSYITEEATR